MDWARSATPHDEIAAAARTNSPDTGIRVRAHMHTQTVGRTEDETTLCQHGTVPAMLMKFI